MAFQAEGKCVPMTPTGQQPCWSTRRSDSRPKKDRVLDDAAYDSRSVPSEELTMRVRPSSFVPGCRLKQQ